MPLFRSRRRDIVVTLGCMTNAEIDALEEPPITGPE